MHMDLFLSHLSWTFFFYHIILSWTFSSYHIHHGPFSITFIMDLFFLSHLSWTFRYHNIYYCTPPTKHTHVQSITLTTALNQTITSTNPLGKKKGGPKKDPLQFKEPALRALLAARVLGHRLRALAHGVLGQLTRQQQTHSRLDLAARDRRTLVVVRQTGSLSSDSLEDIVHKAVHDRHRLAADASVRVNLLQHLVDVDGVALLSPPLTLLVTSTHRLRLTSLFGALGAHFGWHDGVSFFRLWLTVTDRMKE